MFGNDSEPCKVYEYGCLSPVSGEESLLGEIRRRQQFWNKLVEIEHAHRAKVRELLVIPDDILPALYNQLEEVRKEIKIAKQKERSGKVDVVHLQEKAKALREQIAIAKPAQAEAKKQAAEVNRLPLEQLEAERREVVSTAVKASGLYWVNYEEVRNSYELARRKAMRDKTELKFHRWDGTGKVTVRFQNGLLVSDVFGANTKLQINPVPHEAWDHPVRGMRRKMTRTVIRLRVTSDEKRKPVWIELPMVMHRPMPPESKIRCASIVREKVGREWRYKAVITATIKEACKCHGSGHVGINPGWRKVESGLRVAYWADDNGDHNQLVLPLEVLHEFDKLNDIKSIRANYYNEYKDILAKWEVANTLPDWLKEELKTLPTWRSQGRMVALISHWRDARFDGDNEIFEKLMYWRKRENHLYDWEANLRDQVHRRRRELYRIFAAEVVKKYGTVVMGNFDLRKVARKNTPEEGTQGSLPPDHQRFIASISELRLAIKNACNGAGVTVDNQESNNITQTCHSCGYAEKYDAAVQIWHTCPKCRTLYDQDYNAAVNLLHKSFRKSDKV